MKRGFIVFVLLVFVLSLFIVLSPVLGINACCEQDTDGNWCQYKDESNCDENYLSTYTSCEQTSFCQVGCCYSSEEGSCYKNTPRATCEAEEDFSWSDSSECAIDQCNKGCCVIADQAFFVTEVKCKSVGADYEEASVSFDDTIETETACLNSVKNLDFGCCVAGTSAIFQTREECSAVSTEVGVNFTVEGFHEGMLCSSDLLSTECAKQQYTGCYQGKVYWYDSCGNRENIYTSDARESYNSGYVLDEIDSCVASGPYDSSCGNCDYAGGMICGPDDNNVMADGDYTCIDLSCEETYENDASPLSGQDRLNGESWCVYDSRPGEGLDAVGSRHYRHLCINGEEIVEPCEDYREQLCMNGVLNNDVLGNLEGLYLSDGDYVEAACRENRNDCNACNSPESLSERYDCCVNEDYRDCFWLESENVPLEYSYSTDDTPYGVCLPQIPPGLKFWGETSSTEEATAATAEECNVASTTCIVTYRIGGWKNLGTLFGSDNPPPSDAWEIIAESPDGCKTRDWLVTQNTFCKAQGDCGAYYNYVGEPGFEGFRSTMFDEEYFFDFDDLEEKDLGSWEYLVNVDETDEGDVWSGSSPNVWKNPWTYAALASVLTGGISNAISNNQIGAAANCGAQKSLESPGLVDKDGACVDAANADQRCKEGLECIGEVCVPKAKKADTIPAAVTVVATVATTATVDRGMCSDASYDLGDGKDGYYYKCVNGGYKACNVKTGPIGDVLTKANVGSPPVSCVGISTVAPVAPAPEVPQYAPSTSSVVDEVKESVAGQAKGAVMNKIFDSGGCFLTGALPIPTKLFGGAQKTIVTGIANWVTLIAGTYLIVEYANANETMVTYNVDCNLWQPPTGGDNCEVCNDAYAPCSEYKCRSLGASCGLVNEGTSNETCVSLYVNDVNSPLISPKEDGLSEGLTLSETTDEGDKGYEINELIPAFTPVTLAITTDEPALCHYSSETGSEFDTMASTFGSGIYAYEHSITFSLGDEVTQEEIVALTGGIQTVYIRCSDSNGNANERDYFIRFTVDTTPDLSPPEVKYTSIISGSYMPYNATETAFSIYTNEPATCKWNSNDTGYEFMGGEMTCANSGFQQSSEYYGTYECATTLTGVADDELNSFYFKCNDQYGNTNEDSFIFKTKQTEGPLEISSLLPSGILYDLNVSLEIETEGGAEKGNSVCGYSVEEVDYYSMAQFLHTNSSTHSQELSLTEGEYTYYVACQDIAGNRATNSTTFTVEIDTEGPEIEALYVDTIYEVLLLELNEDATCEYASDSFTYGEGIEMQGEDGDYEAKLEAAQYYVICEDVYGNQGNYFIDLSTWV